MRRTRTDQLSSRDNENETQGGKVRKEDVKYALEWVACAAAMPLVVPVVGVLGLSVILTSKGGPFYVSRRLGKGGRVFGCIKLRTMKVGSPMIVDGDAKTVVVPGDERLTPIGRILRSGLDELPQLFNVLVGDMGLIGPRPDTDWMLPRYTEAIRRRLAIRPGVTGLAQVLDSRGALTTAEGYAVDVWYVENHTLRLDLWILCVTPLYVAGFRGVGDRRLRALRAERKDGAAEFQPLPEQRAASTSVEVE